MIKLLVIPILLLSSFVVFSQRNMRVEELTLAGGKGFYSFLYKDTKGESNLNYEYKGGYAYAARFSLKFRYRNVWRFEAGAFQAGSRAIFAGNNIQWNLDYISFGTSYLFKVIDKESRKDFSIYTGLNFNSSYLVKGQQNVNKLNYNLKETNAFKSWNFHGGLIVGAKYLATQRINLSLEYRFDCSLGQIEGADASNGQISRNIGHIATVGIGFNLR
jgi:hypothetical protein